MKRQGLVIVLLLAALALTGGGVLLLREPPENTKETAAETAEEVLFSFGEEEISGICVENKEGGYSASRTENGWEIDGLEDIPLDDSTLHSLVYSVMSLKSVREIADGGDRPEDFGLAEEQASAVVEAELSGGESVRLVVGDEVPSEDQNARYVGKDGRVFVAYNTKVGVFLHSGLQFVEKEITPPTRASAENLTVQSVQISGTGYMEGNPAPLSVRLSENREIAGAALAFYEITSPWEIAADASASVVWTESFFSLAAVETAVVHPSESDLERYGLREPWAEVHLEYANAAGGRGTCEFSLARPDASGMAAVRVSGRDVIYLADVAGTDWVSRRPQDLVSRQLLTPSLQTLSALTIAEEGKTPVVIRFEADAGNSQIRAFLGNAELEDKSFRNFYYTVINQTADEVLFDGAQIPGESEKTAEIRYSYAEGNREDLLEYYRESDRFLLVVKNGGEMCWRMGEAKLTQVLETLERLAAGEEIEARY